MGDRYGTALYPREFVESLPKAGAVETRPLLMLLRGEHSDAEAEIERIERWFRELNGPPERKATLAGNLRSYSKPRNFWSALSELMTSRVFAERGYPASFEVAVAGLTPDFFVQCPGHGEFVVEVLTAFEEEEYRRQDADIRFVASALAEVHHRIAVFIDDVELPAERPSLKHLVRRVSTWLNECRPEESSTLCLSPEEVGLSINLSTVGVRPDPAPIIEGFVGPGGKISTHESIRDALRGKSTKYRAVKEAGLPLVLFLWEGTWLHINPTSLEWALYGQDRVTLTRTREGGKGANWDRAPGGLFGFGPDGGGDPQHTRISAVMYCERVWRAGHVYARLRLYHHPFAASPLAPDIFAGTPQCIPIEATNDRVTVQWDREPGLCLRLS
jgi:hypothetical protein